MLTEKAMMEWRPGGGERGCHCERGSLAKTSKEAGMARARTPRWECTGGIREPGGAPVLQQRVGGRGGKRVRGKQSEK